jgi:hypothetical protein
MLFVNTGYTNAMAGNVLLAFALPEGREDYGHTTLPTNQSSPDKGQRETSSMKGPFHKAANARSDLLQSFNNHIRPTSGEIGKNRQ